MGKIEERQGKVSFLKAWKDFFVGYVDFTGRTTRAGYWWVEIIIQLISGALSFSLVIKLIPAIDFIGETMTPEMYREILPILPLGLITLIFGLAILLPTLTMYVRRLRDVGIRGRGQLVFLGIYMLMLVIFPPDFNAGLKSDSNSVLGNVNYIAQIWSAVILILTLLPTGTLATKQESGVLAFFFKNKKFYDDVEF